MARKSRTVYDPVEIVDIAHKGFCIGRCSDGRVILVEHVVPGDVVKAEYMRRRKGMTYARAIAFHTRSPYRTEPFCDHFGVCGGCKWQNMDYEAQLSFKARAVTESLRRIAQIEDPEVLPILGSKSRKAYRNKLQFSFTDRRWLTEDEIHKGVEYPHRNGLGFHVSGAFAHVVDIDTCYLMAEPMNAIRNGVKAYALDHGLTFHNIRTHQGFLRNLTLRSNRKGEYMVILTCYENNRDLISGVLDYLNDGFPEIISLYYCINPKLNDSDQDLPMHHYAGAECLEEYLGKIKFRIGPKSFFQTNVEQAERLFGAALTFADVRPEETVYDLYTGIGSIALSVARYCKRVVGIEEVEAAIDDAKVNMRLNNIANAEFICGDVKNVLSREFTSTYGKADLIFTDPPRAGMHPDAIAFLLQANPERIVYVSCNPATQARDIALLSEKFECMKSQPVDMFPHTSHIENVALLKNRNHG